MLIRYDPDESKSVSEHHVCPFHEENPGVSYAGCTCSSSHGLVRRPPEEVAEIKRKRKREEEDRFLAEAEAIKVRRRISGEE